MSRLMSDCGESAPITPIKTVDLDGVLDVTSRFRKVKEPLWILTDHLDWASELHGGDPTLFNDHTGFRALRPWKSLGLLAADGDGTEYASATICRAIPARDHRRYMRFPVAYAFEREMYDRQRRHSSHVLAYLDGTGWCTANCSGQPLANPVRLRPEIADFTGMTFGALLWVEYTWGATFRLPGHAPFVVPTDAAGALALFRLRDKPVDGGRRPALRHWVSEHFRRIPTGNSVGVKTHLRGTQRFTWSGIGVELRPSAFDVERAALAERPTP